MKYAIYHQSAFNQYQGFILNYRRELIPLDLCPTFQSLRAFMSLLPVRSNHLITQRCIIKYAAKLPGLSVVNRNKKITFRITDVYQR